MTDYDPFEREVIAKADAAIRRHAMLPLLVGLILLIGLGSVAAFFSVKNSKDTTDASQQADQRNVELTRQLTVLTEQVAAFQRQSNDEAVKFRNDSRLLQLAICAQIEGLAKQAHLQVQPCPRVPVPTPAPSPTP